MKFWLIIIFHSHVIVLPYNFLGYNTTHIVYMFPWYSITVSIHFNVVVFCVTSGNPSLGALMNRGKSSKESRKRAAVCKLEQQLMLVELFWSYLNCTCLVTALLIYSNPVETDTIAA